MICCLDAAAVAAAAAAAAAPVVVSGPKMATMFGTNNELLMTMAVCRVVVINKVICSGLP